MKHIYIMMLILVFRVFDINAQCINYTSTNTENPKGQPGMFSGYDNPFVNHFQWAELTAGGTSFKDIILNTSSGFNQQFMINPFTTNMPSYYSYLLAPQYEMSQMDVKWEDGWELLYLNSGFFPNGDPYNALPGSNPFTPIVGVTHKKIPYFILYNRYRGIVRVFVNLLDEFGEWDNINFKIMYEGKTTGGKVGTLFRHNNPYDMASDQETVNAMVEGQAPHPNSNSQWASFDFQVGFDPCGCGEDMGTNLVIEFEALESVSLELYGRALEADIDAIDLDPNTNDFLGMNSVSEGSDRPGAILYKQISSLLDDYNTRMVQYENDLMAYNSYKNNLTAQAMNALKQDVITGALDIIPTTQLANFIAYNCLDFKHGESTEFFGMTDKELDKAFKDGGKDLLAQGYDFMNLQINGAAPEKPVRPSMPTVSTTEMSFVGTLSNTAGVNLGTFYTPGDYPKGFGNNPQVTPQNYPAYNEKLGLYSLVESPRVKLLEAESYTENLASQSKTGVKKKQIQITLSESLKYYLNKALDFDQEQTTLYGSFIVTLKHKDPFMLPVNGGVTRTLSANNRMKITRSSELCTQNASSFTQDCRNEFEISSDFLPFSKFGEEILMAEFTSTAKIYFEDNNYDPIHEFVESDFNMEIEKIELKVLADMYFDQIGSNDEQVNTSQVFTYLLMDNKKVVNNQIQIVEDERYMPYKFGKVILGEEMISPSHPAVHSVVGSTIYIKNEYVTITSGLSVYPGYTLVIMGKKEVEILPNTTFNPNIIIESQGVFNTGAIQMVSDYTVSSFCQDSENGYKGNIYANKTGRVDQSGTSPSKEVDSNLEFNVFPNPSSSMFNVNIVLPDNSPHSIGIELFDLAGKRISLFEENVFNKSASFEIVTSTMPNGVYLLIIYVDGQVHREKLVVQH